MGNLTKYPLEDGFETTLAQGWNGQLGTASLNASPSFTFPSGITTYVVVDPLKSNMQIAEIDSYDPVGKTINISNITLEKGAGVASIAVNHNVGAKVIISDNYQFWKDILDTVNNKLDGDQDTTWDPATDFGGMVVKSLTTLERDALTNPQNGTIIYNTTDGVHNQYISGQWTTFAIGPTTIFSGNNQTPLVAGEDLTANDAIGITDFKIKVAQQFNTQTDSISTTLIATDIVFIAFKDNDNTDYGTAVIATISGDVITYGLEFVFNTGTTNSIRTALIDTNKVLISYIDTSNSDKITAIVGNITGSVIIYGTEVALSGSFEQVATNSITGLCKLDTDKALIVFTNSFGVTNDGTGVVVSVSGTTITWGTPVVFDAGNITFATCTQITTDKALILYRISGSNIRGIVATITGTVPAYGSSVLLGGTYQASAEGALIDTNKIAIIKDNSSNVGVSIIIISGTVIFEGTTVNFSTGGGNITISAINTTEAFVSYDDFGRVLTISGNIITAPIESTISDMDSKSSVLFDTNRILIGYRDTSDTNGKGIITEIATGYIKADTNFIGFSFDTVLEGVGFNLVTDGVKEGFSGLCVGTEYFVGSTPGTISATGTIKTGLAISDTQLLINAGGF